MNEWEDELEGRQLFGVPAVLTKSEATTLIRDLKLLWQITYGQPPHHLQEDLNRTRRFFDPVARGHTLRERLSELESLPSTVFSRLVSYGEPLVVRVGPGVLLAGVEARLMIKLLAEVPADGSHIILSEDSAIWAQQSALTLYRAWTLTRLRQVIDLRAGAGPEVMQAVAVGLVLALLVNRSDSPERAVTQWDRATPDDRDVDTALYNSAESFAAAISSKHGRSSSEQRLKGGYGFTEARRRLAHRLVVIPKSNVGEAKIYIPHQYRTEVIDFLGKDLARRSSLTAATLDRGFDELVVQFRSSARTLAYRSMVFEQPAETARIKKDLLDVFTRARGNISNVEYTDGDESDLNASNA
jgi:hypothetical protein